MNEKTVTAIYLDREYEHGTVQVDSKNGPEWNCTAHIDLILISENYESFYLEIQEVVRKYAI